MKKTRKRIVLFLSLIVVVSTLFFTQCFLNPLGSGGSIPVKFSFNISKLFNGVRVQITWSAVKGALYYEVYRSESENTGFSQIAVLTNLSSATTVNQVTVTTVYDVITHLSKTYYYKIKAYKTSFGWTSLMGSGSVSTVDNYEDDDSFNEAKKIGVGETQTHSINYGDDSWDYLYFQVDMPGSYVITLSPAGNGYNKGTFLSLYDSSHNGIDTSNYCAAGNTVAITNNCSSGIYYVAIWANNNTPCEYNITVNAN